MLASRAAIIAAIGLWAGVALADPPPPAAKAACRSSALALCRDQALAGDRAGVRACLIRNYAKVTPECQAAMKAQQAQEMAKPEVAPPKP